VIGALSEAVSLPVGTAVTCPTVRTHPAVVAHAAATAAVMSDGRFRLGVGTGEALNEHVLGDAWPPAHIRLDMLEEAVQIMRRLFSGEEVNHPARTTPWRTPASTPSRRNPCRSTSPASDRRRRNW